MTPELPKETVMETALEVPAAEPQLLDAPAFDYGTRAVTKDMARRRMLLAADAVAALAAALAAGAVAGGSAATVLWTFALLPAWLVVAKLQGLYDRDHLKVRHLTIDELPAIFYWATLCVSGTAFALAWLPAAGVGARGAAAMWLTAFAGATCLRAAMRAIWRRVVAPDRALVVGFGPLAEAVGRKLRLEHGHHMTIERTVRLAGHDNADDGAEGDRPVSLAELQAIIRGGDVDRVLVAVRDLDEEMLAAVLDACRRADVKLSVVPPLRAVLGTAVSLNHIAELPLIEFRTWDASMSTMLIKRLFDLVLGSLLVIVTAPLMVAIALAIKLTSRGPVLFVQTRAGRHGDPFPMLKFRTMVRDAEAKLAELVDLEQLDDPMFKLRNDPRITRVGRFLRRLSLDELPQLLNVLAGQMSLVGPRPEEARLVERYGEPARKRLEMRPGLTGPMQVHGRGELTFQERLAVDREYVENYSFRKDIDVLLRTAEVVLRGRGAF